MLAVLIVAILLASGGLERRRASRARRRWTETCAVADQLRADLDATELRCDAIGRVAA